MYLNSMGDIFIESVNLNGKNDDAEIIIKCSPRLAWSLITTAEKNGPLTTAKYFLNTFLCARYLPQKVIFNNPATIIFWDDGTKTVVKCQGGDTFSEEAGIALCFMKKMLGNKGNYNKVLREALEKAQRQGE